MKSYQLKRPIEKKVRFNHEESQYIKKKILDSPFNDFQNFARTTLINSDPTYYDYSELRQLVSEVNSIGNNINQVVRLANQFQDISSEDITDLTQQLNELNQLVKKKFSEEIAKERNH